MTDLYIHYKNKSLSTQETAMYLDLYTRTGEGCLMEWMLYCQAGFTHHSSRNSLHCAGAKGERAAAGRRTAERGPAGLIHSIMNSRTSSLMMIMKRILTGFLLKVHPSASPFRVFTSLRTVGCNVVPEVFLYKSIKRDKWQGLLSRLIPSLKYILMQSWDTCMRSEENSTFLALIDNNLIELSC